MEQQLRALLYNNLEGRKVAFNPVEPEPFDLVDLTRDVTNSTRIYHLRTECVREALAGAKLIVTDSQALADVVRRALPRTAVIALPFGPMRTTGRPVPSLSPVVGLLNHSGEVEMNNAYSLKLLKSLGRKLLIYGRELPGLEADVIPADQFDLFCERIDILLLPSLPGTLNSPTLPLAVMAAGNAAVLADNAPGYYNLDAATGVQILPHDSDAWRLRLDILESQPVKLRTMQTRNRAFATRLNRESYTRMAMFQAQYVVPPQPPIRGCGCKKG